MTTRAEAEIMSDDERRLLRMFRCLPCHQQSQVMIDVGSDAMERCLPNQSVDDFMPIAGGVEPQRIEGNYDEIIQQEGTIVEILHNGIEATGEAEETLLGSSLWDKEEVFPRFAQGAGEIATQQGSFFRYDERFAAKYIAAWRWEIVCACERAAKAMAAKETDEETD